MSLITLFYLLIILLAAFLGGAFLKYLKQPPIIGYLLAGFFLGLFFEKQIAPESVNFLSELGVVLLLFTLGLEFSFGRLKKLGWVAIFGPLVQLVITIFLLLLLLQQLGWEFFPSLFTAAAFSLSSTAIVVKLMIDRAEMETVAGEIMTGWLILQDLAVLPMMIILPVLGKYLFVNHISSQAIFIILQNLALALAVIGGMLIFGRVMTPFVISQVARLNSRELLLAAVFIVAVVGAIVTYGLGLSPALGAFLAGMLISESVEQHAVFSEIRPLRDLFSLLFFASLGLVIPAGFVFEHFWSILIITFLVMLIKFAVVMVISLYSGYHAKTSFVLAVGLIEVGEFAFILAQTGLEQKVLDITTYGYILSVGLLSILFMPSLYLATPRFYTRVREFSKMRWRKFYLAYFTRSEHRDTLEELTLTDHVVLCGYGRVGKYIGRALSMAEIPYIVVDYNRQKVDRLKKAGVNAVYGDPADFAILDLVQVDHAKSVVIAIPDFHTQEQIITHSLTLKKDVKIYCRTHVEEHQQILKALGVSTIIQPEFEAALSITEKILKSYGKQAEYIDGKISRLKIEHGLG